LTDGAAPQLADAGDAAPPAVDYGRRALCDDAGAHADDEICNHEAQRQSRTRLQDTTSATVPLAGDAKELARLVGRSQTANRRKTG